MSTSVPVVPTHSVAGRRTAVAPSIGKLLTRLETAFRVWGERRRLSALDERMLHDLGISRADVDREASRSFFDLPDHR